jgi:protein SCO1/2
MTFFAISSAPAEEKPVGKWLYQKQLRVNFEDQNAEKIALTVYQGSPVLVAMFYTSCPYACPMLLAKLKAIDTRLSEEARQQLRYLLISFDAKHDTPQTLKKIVKQYELDEKRWRLLHADEATVQLMAAILEVSVRPMGDKDFAHSSVITLLDRQGRIDQQIDGNGVVNNEFLQRLEELTLGK